MPRSRRALPNKRKTKHVGRDAAAAGARRFLSKKLPSSAVTAKRKAAAAARKRRVTVNARGPDREHPARAGIGKRDAPVRKYLKKQRRPRMAIRNPTRRARA